jgi:hypothetical protein
VRAGAEELQRPRREAPDPSGPLFNAVIRRKDGAWIKEALDEKELPPLQAPEGI